MQEVAAESARQQCDRWIEEGQHLMALLPGLFEQNDRLRGEVAAAEKERERIRRELEELKAENHTLRDERTEVRDTFSTFMDDIQQLMNDVLQKLSAMQKKSPFERAV